MVLGHRIQISWYINGIFGMEALEVFSTSPNGQEIQMSKKQY